MRLKRFALRATLCVTAGALAGCALMTARDSGSMYVEAEMAGPAGEVASPSAPARALPDRDQDPIGDLIARLGASEAPAPAALQRARLAEHIAATYHVAPASAARIVDRAYAEGRANGVAPTLVLAVIAQESSFREDARSSVGAVGLMQVRPELHDRRRSQLGLRGPLKDAGTNIAVGSSILKDCLRRNHGDMSRALARYSGGARNYPAKVERLQHGLIQVARGTRPGAQRPLAHAVAVADRHPDRTAVASND